jgi:PRTRC genetic system ParB family protein
MSNITEQGHLSHLSIAEIHIKDGFNPRKFIDDAKFKELVSSIKQNGIIQPIVVRPTHDAQFGGYWVVAGERRYKAAVELGLESIPALRKELSDHEAKLIATVENTQRDDMSPAEESQAARDVLMGCHNDRKEAIKLLGWSNNKFEARLLLLHADQAVLDALTERHIKLGHAELLSQLPKDFQVATLAKILESGYSVADLKSRLAAFSLDLSKACFNLADCHGCPHNSTLQSSLFDDHISAGKCANRECFEQKTENAMLDKKAALSEQYAVVYLDTEGTPDSYKVTCQSGATGVGRNQFEQGCKQCAHFGALLSIAPDSLGKITEDCCFNMDCHKGTGQVILGTLGRLAEKDVSLPTVYDFYPDLDGMQDNDAPSCSMEEALANQDLPINRTIANVVMQLIWSLLRHGGLNHQGAYVDIRKGTMVPINILV